MDRDVLCRHCREFLKCNQVLLHYVNTHQDKIFNLDDYLPVPSFNENLLRIENDKLFLITAFINVSGIYVWAKVINSKEKYSLQIQLFQNNQLIFENQPKLIKTYKEYNFNYLDDFVLIDERINSEIRVGISIFKIKEELIANQVKLLKKLECPVCMEILEETVHQCINGHIICGTCESKLDNCPSCKESIEYGNAFIESILESDLVQLREEKYWDPEIMKSKDDLYQLKMETKFKKISCPECRYCVTASHLVVHLIGDHPHIIWSFNSKLKLNSSNTEDKCYFRKQHNQIFLIKLKQNENRFYCSVSTFSSSNSKYNFKIKVHYNNYTEESSTKLVTNSDDKITFNNELYYKYNKMEGEFEISLYINDLSWMKNSENLECRNCLEYFTAPVYQCSNGHTICNLCNRKINKCEICIRTIGIRNLFIDSIISDIQFPCKFIGCEKELKIDEKKMHELNCYFRKV